MRGRTHGQDVRFGNLTADGVRRQRRFKQIKAGGDGRGLVLYDPGYVNTAPCRSKISYIDGDRGILRYRGYPIEALAESSAYLSRRSALVYGDLPNASQLMEWERAIARHSALPVQVVHAIEALPHDAHPMAVMLAGLNSLSSMHPNKIRQSPGVVFTTHTRFRINKSCESLGR